jgi:glycosyltransferase involved in cell wall biosynthesis
MQYLLLNNKNVVTGVADRPLTVGNQKVISIESDLSPDELLGRQMINKSPEGMKVAVICNWRDTCGISTYSKYLVDALRPKVGEIRIFSEFGPEVDTDRTENVIRCWKRGESMSLAIKLIQDYKPDFVLVQHEYGIFPKATYFLQLIQALDAYPYALVLHSVYKHLDKTICTSAIRNIIVHSEAAKAVLIETGHAASNISVIPHGCVVFNDVKELWNIFQTPYCIVQFGFGFFYKGVDRAIEAVAHLKRTDKKFQDIFYCYLCSETNKCNSIHNSYLDYLMKKVEDLGVQDNVAIVRKFHTDEVINNYLRTAKLALFPYITDPDNTVYGASGAARVAMANKIPTIASESHLFDDLEGVLPRPKDYLELAKAIDEVFSNGQHKAKMLASAERYVAENNWSITADRYVEAIKKITSQNCYL